jgi:hypothetical protein
MAKLFFNLLHRVTYLPRYRPCLIVGSATRPLRSPALADLFVQIERIETTGILRSFGSLPSGLVATG